MADTNNQYSFLDYSGLTLFWNNIKKIIEDNEFVTATALTNLDTRVDTLEGLTSPFIMQKTYAELVELRDNNNLVPGQQYRIIDYETTTKQENTQSAGHQFDIIVTANDESTLNEVARAIKHDGDTYFTEAGANLSAWKIWYCLDNDSDRFAWADTENGKGVIYRMIDEFNNDCPYDFKNIMFVRYELNAPDEYVAGRPSERCAEVCSKNVRDMFAKNQMSYIWSGLNGSDKYWTDGVLSSSTGVTKTFYTFTGNDDNDASLQNYCHDNKMSFCNRLPNNIFFGNAARSNSLGDECYDNSFDNECYHNTFGNNCCENVFGSVCYSNTFGNKCTNNSVGNTFTGNKFRNDCSYNSFDNECEYNTFGNACSSNSFDYECRNNILGNSCIDNSFCNICNNNIVGNQCNFNVFGDQCNSNSIGNSCEYNMFGDFCNYNSFGNSCFGNWLGDNCRANSFGNYCDSNSFRVSGDNTSSLIGYCRYNAFDDGCSNNIIYSANTNSSTYLENYHINKGVKGTDSNPMLIDAQYLNAENVCNVYKKGDVAVVSYIQY